MTDRELLELAAKAAGISYDAEKSLPVEGRKWWGLWLSFVDEPGEFARRHWNPLTDDGDALRLAVKLDMCVVVDGEHNHVRVYAQSFARPEEGYGACGFGPDKCAATRRAIVRAAAEIGKAML